MENGLLLNLKKRSNLVLDLFVIRDRQSDLLSYQNWEYRKFLKYRLRCESQICLKKTLQSEKPQRTSNFLGGKCVSTAFAASHAVHLPCSIYMLICVNTCQYVSICVNKCQYASICVNICQQMSIYVNKCQYMSLNVNKCQYIYKHILTYIDIYQ